MSGENTRLVDRPACTREEQLLAMIASGHVDAATARGALSELRSAHVRADNTLTLLKPRPEVEPE